MAQSDTDIVIVPVPTAGGAVTWAAARLVLAEGAPFAEAITATPDATFAPPQRIALSSESLTRLRPGRPGRAGLYFYEGMVMPAPASPRPGSRGDA